MLWGHGEKRCLTGCIVVLITESLHTSGQSLVRVARIERLDCWSMMSSLVRVSCLRCRSFPDGGTSDARLPRKAMSVLLPYVYLGIDVYWARGIDSFSRSHMQMRHIRETKGNYSPKREVNESRESFAFEFWFAVRHTFTSRESGTSKLKQSITWATSSKEKIHIMRMA